ncbi:MAG: aconitase X catalytic domain-containing protein [Crenarchaeota archaeon]|nr:aconitase X catalytic domain-containing protein [Thermoproteota archaeon]
MKKRVTKKVFKKILDSIQTGKKRYIKISSAHLSGISYLNIGDAGLEFLEDLSRSGLKFKVRTTINPGCVDYSSAIKCDPEVVEKQKRIIRSLKNIGAIESLTCTPYLFDNPLKRNQKIAWAESSAALYANSIIGASTNKEGSLTALASAILGYTVRTGIHLRNGKKPKIRFEYEGELKDEVDCGLLGYVMGLKAGTEIPYLQIKKCIGSILCYKQLLAGFGTSGSAPMVWIENLTPGFSRVKKPKRKIIIDRAELEEEKKILSEEAPLFHSNRMIFVTGCPHMSLEEIKSFHEALRNIEKLSMEAWVFTSRNVYSEAFRRGLLTDLFEKGVRVFKDSCIMHCSLKNSGIHVITNSVKAAYYLRGSLRLKTTLKSLKELVDEYGGK